jgi:3-isopropylmalate dehydrogenase
LTIQHRIALLEGDGIGPEISRAALTVLVAVQKKFDVRFEIQTVAAGDECLKRRGEALPADSIASIRGSDVCLKAPVGETAADVIVRLRQMLNLYANIRPCKTLPGIESLKPNIDLVIVRENTEDLYRGLEFEIPDGVVALRLTTGTASRRIANYAFKLAESRGALKRVVAVHKSNVMRKGDGLFSRVCGEVASEHPSIEFSEMLVDAAAMNLIRSPESFDVIVTTNLFGDILSDEAAQLVGGLGVAPSANIGDDFALFEPVHGSAPGIAGKGVANPTAMILTTAMMMEWLALSKGNSEYSRAAAQVKRSVSAVLASGKRTPDLGGDLSTDQLGRAVAVELTSR